MKLKRILVLLLACMPLANVFADGNEDAKKQINKIKKDNSYLYAETTAASQDEAKAFAEDMLHQEINEWVAKQKKLRGSSNLVVNNKQTIWTTMALPRGNMFRSFIYVKKSDILPVTNSEVIANTNAPASGDTGVAPAKVEVIIPDVVKELSGYTDYKTFAAQVMQLKTSGKITKYAYYAQLDNPDNYYLAIYNRAGNVVAILTPGNARRNIRTGQSDSVSNYKGCGAIGFQVQ